MPRLNYQSTVRGLGLLLGFGLLVAGCEPSSTPADQTQTTCGVSLVDTDQVTFYGDLLPILSSQVEGAVYKCTTCHAAAPEDYTKPEGMNSLSEVNKVIDSMQTKYMPRGGDLVPPEKIALFRQWQLSGFPPGVPGQAPSAASGGLTGGATSGATSGTAAGKSGC